MKAIPMMYMSIRACVCRAYEVCLRLGDIHGRRTKEKNARRRTRFRAGPGQVTRTATSASALPKGIAL